MAVRLVPPPQVNVMITNPVFFRNGLKKRKSYPALTSVMSSKQVLYLATANAGLG
jgi:hypothetical protein